MRTLTLIGHLGGDAVIKNSNGKDFAAFRVADSNKWTDSEGIEHEETTWIDCVLNGNEKVLPYLKKGQQVYVSGSCSLRIYSSKKDRCMKPGLTISVRQIELIGGRSEEVPAKLYNPKNNTEIPVEKYYLAKLMQRESTAEEWLPLVSTQNKQYVVDRNGWVFPAANKTE